MLEELTSAVTVGGVLTLLLMAGATAYLWWVERGPAFASWSLAFLALGVHFLFVQSFFGSGDVKDAAALVVAHSLATTLLLTGTLEFVGKPVPRLALWVTLMAFVLWIGVCLILKVPQAAIIVPGFLLPGAEIVISGMVFWRRRLVEPGLGFGVVGALLILDGLHSMDFPILSPFEVLRPFGVTLAVALLSASSVMLVVVAKRVQHVRAQRLAEALSQSEHEIRELNATLERRVEERTAELKDVQDALVRQERLAVLGQLTATVSHELRNPLGAMRTSVAAIKKLSRKGDPLLISSADIVDRSITRCDTVIADLLNFVQVPKLNEEPTVVDELLTVTLAEYTLPAPEIVLRQALGCDAVVNVDRDRLRRALENVLNNACQAMTDLGNDNAIDGDKLLTVVSRMEDGRAEIEIADLGGGVPAELRDKIFEPLFTTKGCGVGLGLPIVKGIMVEHGGGVDLTSTVGEVTQVVLWLPAQNADKCSKGH